MILIVSGCSQPSSPPQRNFSPVDLLIDVSVLPSGWKVNIPPQATRVFLRKNHGGANVQFGYPYAGHILHEVSRFNDREDAAEAYRDQDYYSGAINVWVTPKEFSYRSPVADQFRLACVERPRITECVAMAQYQEFVSALLVNVDSYAITLTDIERVIRVIDEQMARALNKTMPTLTKPP
jgi:hypothetical protein